jgi:hypothetical protein
MALYIQSANALVSRVAQWVGAIPKATAITASAFNASTNVITVSSTPVGTINVGDFIGVSVGGPYTAVTAVSSTTIAVTDPDGVWASATYSTLILLLPTQASLEIQSCIQLAELKMRTLELPGLRSNPYDETTPSILTTNTNGLAPIPTDMNIPILFFQETPNSQVAPGTPAASMGPWIMYDRVGDREIIRRRMIDQLYVRPFGVPRVIRGSFSEVGPNYVFTPNPGNAVTIKAYYIKTFPFLFGTTTDTLNPITQNNAVLASFPEGYLYGTLWAYYDKNKNTTESQKWLARLDESYGLIEDQYNKGRWKGGDQHLTSEFQPRDYRYSFK